MITLAVDCMGGDHGPTVTLEACRQFLDSHPDASLLLVGHPDHIPLKHPRARIVPALERVEMQQLQIGDLKKNSTTTETRLTNLKGQSGAKLFGRFSFLAGVASLFRNW